MKSRSTKTPSTLPDSVHERLNKYALAASAAGVSILALGQSAEARVVYTPTHRWLPLNQYHHLDLNHDGVNDFRFILTSSIRSSGFARGLTVEQVATSQVQNAIYSVSSQHVLCAAALPKGTKVGPKSPGFRGQMKAAFMFQIASNPDCTSYWKFGPWMNVKGQAYLGVKFAIKGQVHYGWARLGHISHNKPPKAELTGYAYETIPNKPIITGKTKGPDVGTLQPGSAPATLGRLALGRK
jgi:hypothetical protein